MEATLWESIQTLAPLGPRFVSVTYGAGGATRERTHATVARIQRETPLAAAPHLTCAEANKAGIASVTEQYWASGGRHLGALRDDPTRAGAHFQHPPAAHRHTTKPRQGLR